MRYAFLIPPGGGIYIHSRHGQRIPSQSLQIYDAPTFDWLDMSDRDPITYRVFFYITGIGKCVWCFFYCGITDSWKIHLKIRPISLFLPLIKHWWAAPGCHLWDVKQWRRVHRCGGDHHFEGSRPSVPRPSLFPHATSGPLCILF